MIATIGVYSVALITLPASPVVVFAGLRMMEGRSRGLVLAGAIISMLPLTACCFVAGLPAGIWAIVVLRRDDVKVFFAKVSEVG